MDILKIKETGEYIIRFSKREMLSIPEDLLEEFGYILEKINEAVADEVTIQEESGS